MLTIASPNTDRSLLTLAELRAAAGVSDGSRDAELTAMGGYVAAMITKACRVARAGEIPPTLRLETVVETIRLGGVQPYLALSRRPVVAITSVSEDGSALDASEYENDSLLYKLSSAARIDWPTGLKSIEYSAGYAIVPDDLKYAAIKFVQSEVVRGRRDPLLRRESVPGLGEYEYWVDPTKDAIVPAEVMDILMRGGFVNQYAWMR